ncbi:class I SAM-dependent methyltransferase [Burkholderia territorii]|uniref:class I SAM-dependent methyltransferase n=1 Tax=Burkholderia territorii TaxID=1503055 RepID=UPI0009BDC123|nr:class I SAM-dependent methyltransferase [Burkholderia territorii]
MWVSRRGTASISRSVFPAFANTAKTGLAEMQRRERFQQRRRCLFLSNESLFRHIRYEPRLSAGIHLYTYRRHHKMNHRDYSYYLHGQTEYMKQVLQHFAACCPEKTRILDIPSGSGVFAASLNALGHDVVQADIHGYGGSVVADMEAPLPFQNDEFGAVTCLEGVEHVLNPVNLISELVRVTKQKGTIIVSTPNVSNLHSRLQFLFTGTFFQFDARGARQTLGASVDRGHVSPFTPLQLIYVFGAMGCTLKGVRIDRRKRMALIPLYLLLKPLSILWTRKVTRGTSPGTYPGVASVSRLLTGFKLMFGRSQILIFEKMQ